jgi:hypothetical protein
MRAGERERRGGRAGAGGAGRQEKQEEAGVEVELGGGRHALVELSPRY